MSADLLAAAEKDNDLEAMCRITTEHEFDFDTVFSFLHEYRTKCHPVTPVLKNFLLWALDHIHDDRSRDKGDYVLQTIDIAVEHNDVAFFTAVVKHPAVGKSAWPMMGVCSRQKLNLIDVLFDLYDRNEIEQLAQGMLKSNLKDGVRAHLEENLCLRQARYISEHLKHPVQKNALPRKI